MVTTRSGLKYSIESKPQGTKIKHARRCEGRIKPRQPYRKRYFRPSRSLLGTLPAELRIKVYDDLLPRKPCAWNFEGYVALMKIRNWNQPTDPPVLPAQRQDNHPDAIRFVTSERLWSGPWSVHFTEPVCTAARESNNRATGAMRHYLQAQYGPDDQLPLTTDRVFDDGYNHEMEKPMFATAFTYFSVDYTNLQIPGFGYGYRELQKQIPRMFFYMRDIIGTEFLTCVQIMQYLAKGVNDIIKDCTALKEVVVQLHVLGPKFEYWFDTDILSYAEAFLTHLSSISEDLPVQSITILTDYSMLHNEKYGIKVEYAFDRTADPPKWRRGAVELRHNPHDTLLERPVRRSSKVWRENPEVGQYFPIH